MTMVMLMNHSFQSCTIAKRWRKRRSHWRKRSLGAFVVSRTEKYQRSRRSSSERSCLMTTRRSSASRRWSYATVTNAPLIPGRGQPTLIRFSSFSVGRSLSFSGAPCPTRDASSAATFWLSSTAWCGSAASHTSWCSWQPMLVSETSTNIIALQITWKIVPDTVMGLTFLAAGTSVPEAVSSVIITAQGHGSMGISNTIGSNIFNILLCLGLPWLIKTLFVPTISGEPWVSRSTINQSFSLTLKSTDQAQLNGHRVLNGLAVRHTHPTVLGARDQPIQAR